MNFYVAIRLLQHFFMTYMENWNHAERLKLNSFKIDFFRRRFSMALTINVIPQVAASNSGQRLLQNQTSVNAEAFIDEVVINSYFFIAIKALRYWYWNRLPLASKISLNWLDRLNMISPIYSTSIHKHVVTICILIRYMVSEY